MFLAIINESYSAVKEEASNKRGGKEFQEVDFKRKIKNKLRRVCCLPPLRTDDGTENIQNQNTTNNNSKVPSAFSSLSLRHENFMEQHRKSRIAKSRNTLINAKIPRNIIDEVYKEKQTNDDDEQTENQSPLQRRATILEQKRAARNTAFVIGQEQNQEKIDDLYELVGDLAESLSMVARKLEKTEKRLKRDRQQKGQKEPPKTKDIESIEREPIEKPVKSKKSRPKSKR